MLAHLGGVAVEETLIYLVPPLAVLAWISLLGRRERRQPGPPAEQVEEQSTDPAGTGTAGREPGEVKKP